MPEVQYSAWQLMDVRASVQCSDLGGSCDGARVAIAQSDIPLANATSRVERTLDCTREAIAGYLTPCFFA